MASRILWRTNSSGKRSCGFRIELSPTTTREEALGVLRDGFSPQVVVLGQGAGSEQGDADLAMPTETISALRAVKPDLPVVILCNGPASSLVGDYEHVEQVERRHAADTIDAALVRLLRTARSGNHAAEHPEQEPPLIAASPAMRAIRDLIRQVADTDVPVLITGESGVGKEVIARRLHRDSYRSGPFVKVNCPALPDQLLESEVFGYEPGAFTGAERTKPGKFELAHDGTILLDEIGEISGGTQAKLLQVLQDGCYFRLGGDREISVDARVVASTNCDLEREMAEGNFRKDLFYRLNVIRIPVPPLRQRREEIPLLAQHFVRQYEAEYGRAIGQLSDGTLETLARHDWPGNVRELENLVRRMVVLQDVEGALQMLARSRSAAKPGGLDVEAFIGPAGAIPPLKEVSRLAALEVEGELIRRALDRTGWNRRQAAKLLDISYKTLLYKIRDCGISNAA